MMGAFWSCRTLPTSEPIETGVLVLVDGAIGFCLDELKIRDHLFVSLVSAPCLRFGDEFAFAAYSRGEFHVMVAACYDETIDDMDRGNWLDELVVSTFHEIVHFKQDIEGRLYVTDEEADEFEADTIARHVFDKWKDDQSSRLSGG